MGYASVLQSTKIGASMQQQTPSRRKTFLNLFPSAAAALATVATLAACDRPSIQPVEAPAPGRMASVQEGGPPAGAAASEPLPLPATRLPSREALGDAVITATIKAAILTDPGMAGADVSVNTDHGVVALAGIVKNPEQTAIASAHAQRQDGVMRVDNHLSVPPT